VNLDWRWLDRNTGHLATLVGQHALLAVVPVLVALVVALPLGHLLFRTGRAAGPLLAVLRVVSSIPALALFVTVPLVLPPHQILDPLNVAVALTVHGVALLVRSVVDGLRSVPDPVRQSASAAGFGWFGRLVRVELPLAMPAVFAGLRVVTMSNIALVSVAALVGSGALGQLFQQAYTTRAFTPLVAGLVLSVALALLADAVILLVRRGTLPWARGQRA